jgi:hypothetical protein
VAVAVGDGDGVAPCGVGVELGVGDGVAPTGVGVDVAPLLGGEVGAPGLDGALGVLVPLPPPPQATRTPSAITAVNATTVFGKFLMITKERRPY